ncbi:hypothetical protein [Shinella sp.]|jgi:hypothetical protein
MDLFSQIAICCRVMAVGAWISVIDALAVSLPPETPMAAVAPCSRRAEIE